MLRAVALLLSLGVSGLAVAGTPTEEPQRLLNEATAHYRAGRPVEAVQLYQQYLAHYSDRVDVRFFLGAALLSLNQLEAAWEQARRALDLDEDFARAYALIGRVHAAKGEWDRAQQAYQEALRLDPQDRDTWYFLGRCLLEAGRFELAIEAFQRALSLKAEYSRTYESLGLTYEALLQFEAAEKAYRRAVELIATRAVGNAVPGNPSRAFLAYGTFLYRQGRFEESLSLLQQAVSADSGAAEARFELAKVLLRLGRLEEAARESQRALAVSDQCRFRYLLARIYLLQDRKTEANEQLRQAKDCDRR